MSGVGGARVSAAKGRGRSGNKAAGRKAAGRKAAGSKASSGKAAGNRATGNKAGGSRRVVNARSARDATSGLTGSVPVDQLRWTCPPLKPAKKAPTAKFLIGQERPMAAMRTGLSIHAQGYNIFVSGLRNQLPRTQSAAVDFAAARPRSRVPQRPGGARQGLARSVAQHPSVATASHVAPHGETGQQHA